MLASTEKASQSRWGANLLSRAYDCEEARRCVGGSVGDETDVAFCSLTPPDDSDGSLSEPLRVKYRVYRAPPHLIEEAAIGRR